MEAFARDKQADMGPDMPKRPDTLETTLLAIELLRRIPRSRRITATELHEQMRHAGIDRDLRTIQRQLDTLSEHFDIERDDRARPYGYRWKPYAKGLSLAMLSEQESLLLRLAEQQLRQLLPGSVMKAMDGFFQQARNQLGSDMHDKPAQQWLSKVRVISETQPLLPPKVADGVFDIVTGALYANHWLDIEYRNATGKQKGARVMPLGLAQQGVRLYLVCRYAGYDDERILALHRILSAQATNMPFERPAGFDLGQYDANGRFGLGDGKRVDLVFCIDKETGYHLLESKLAHNQRVEIREDCYEISATVVQSLQLERWLNSFGDQVWDIRLSDGHDDKYVVAPVSPRHSLSQG